MITELTAEELAWAFLPMITFSAPVVPFAPAPYPTITLSSAVVIVLYAPTPIITLPSALFNVPVVVSPILILLVKLGALNFTSTKSFNFLAPAYSPVTTPPDVYAPKPVPSSDVARPSSVYNANVFEVKTLA